MPQPKYTYNKPVELSKRQRPIFAAYLNMARMNLYNVLKHVSATVGIDDDTEEDSIAEMRLVVIRKMNSYVENRARKELERAIPVLKVFGKDMNNSDFRSQMLKNLLGTVSDLRNRYTHVAQYLTADEEAAEQERIRYVTDKLDLAYHSALEKIENSRAYTGEQLQLARRQMKWGNRFNPHTPDGNGLAPIGLVLLIGKLLTKKYANLFVNQCGLFTTTTIRDVGKNDMMKALFCTDCLVLPKTTIHTTESENSIALSILHELQHTPSEVHKALTPAEREELSSIERKRDHFPLFALQYIDTMGVMPSIAFQVSAGWFHYGFRRHVAINNTRVKASNSREIYGFGKASSLDAMRERQYGPLFIGKEKGSTKPFQPYMDDTPCRYNIAANRIGLMWNDNSIRPLTNGNHLPPCDPEARVVGKGVAPRCWLSVHDLPALAFLHMLGGNPEQIIKDTYGRIDKLFADLAAGAFPPPQTTDAEGTIAREKLEEMLTATYHLHVNQLPSKITDCLTGKAKPVNQDEGELDEAHFNSHADSTLRRELAFTERRLEGTSEAGAPGDNASKMARFLTKDLLTLRQVPDGCTYNIRREDVLVLKNFIATYRKKKRHDGQETDQQPRLKKMLQRANLLDTDALGKPDNPAKHPFIDSILGNELYNTTDLYNKYLRARKDWLLEMRQKSDYSKLNFLHGKREKYKQRTPQWLKDAAQRYRKDIMLPDGLFTDAIIGQLKQQANPILAEALASDKRPAASQLIRLWFNEVVGDSTQPFYRYADVYERLDHKAQRAMRRHCVNDMIMFMMAKRLLFGEGSSSLKLENINNGEGGILSEPGHFSITLQLRDEAGRPITDGDKPMERVIFQDNLKLKKHGEFKKYLHDPRIGTLLSKAECSDGRVERSLLEKELEHYDRARTEIYNSIHSIERKIINNNQVLQLHGKWIKEPYVNSFRGLLTLSNAFDEETKEHIIDIRNAFSHNKYPNDWSIITDKTLPHVANGFAQWLKLTIEKTENNN